MSDDEVRLYSTKRRAPVDVIAEQHIAIHGWLDRWGRWNRGGGAGPSTCNSVEGNFDAGAGGREAKQPIVSLPPNPVFPRITRAVWYMPVDHGETVRLFYVGKLTKRGGRATLSPEEICRLYRLRWEGFPAWMFACRAMVLNVLRRDGLVLDGEAP